MHVLLHACGARTSHASLALRKLTVRHFYEYCIGAMGDPLQPADEIRYFAALARAGRSGGRD